MDDGPFVRASQTHAVFSELFTGNTQSDEGRDFITQNTASELEKQDVPHWLGDTLG